jgi:CBS domain containing-hemolysin-like protein
MELWTFSWQMMVIVLLVMANAFFVASEFAIVKIRSSQLKPLLKTGNWRVPIALHITQRLDAYLSVNQLGITLTSIGLGFAGEPFLGEWIEKGLRAGGLDNPALAHTLSFSAAFGTVTFLHIVIGELAPKSLAIQKPKPVTLWCAPFLRFFYYLFLPFIYVLNNTANALLRLLGIRPASEDHAFSHDELRFVLSSAQHVHPGDELINKLLVKALRIKETTAEDIMLPREDMVCLWGDKSLEENLRIAQTAGYSRLPYCVGSADHILGVVHVKEVLWQLRFLPGQTDLANLLHPILTFTAKTRLPAMLELFRKSRNHLAVVVDADGHTLGLVSFEDVLEELVGDIKDEFDIEKGPFFELGPDTALVDGDLPFRDLLTEMNWELPHESGETVTEWALRHWGRKPKAGEELVVDGTTIRAEEVSATGLRRVRFRRTPVPAAH